MKILNCLRLALPKKEMSFLCLFLLLAFVLVNPSKAFANYYASINYEILGEQMDEFAQKGAAGFLIWQYSGNLSNNEYFANDPYSFFQDRPDGAVACALLREKAPLFEFIGVNMWDIGSDAYSQELVEKHFRWLRNECGVNMVRTFAKAGEASGMQKVLAAAGNTDLNIIITIGDYSNGGGGIPRGAGADWYRDGYGEHREFSAQIANAVGGHPNLYTLELANEPHCGGNPPSTIEYYTNWGRDVGSILQGRAPYVGYGQMASPDGVCDSPYTDGFRNSNSIEQINITSAHYYNNRELESSFLALEISQSLGRKFYVGEASWDDVDERYDLLPIVINPDQFSGSPVDILSESLVRDQGYEVHCASPEWTLGATYHNAHIAEYFYNQYQYSHNQLITFEGEGVYSLNLNNARIPVYRSSEGSAQVSKTSSYEAFFGSLVPELVAETSSGVTATGSLDQSAPVYSGVANHLLSPAQLCQIKYQNLGVIDSICSSLSDPGSCYLNNPIRNSEYSRWELYHELSGLLAEPGSSGINHLTCEDLAGSWETLEKRKPSAINTHNLSKDKFNQIQSALNNLSIDIENLYRIAFLVISPLQDPMTGSSDAAGFYEHNHPEHAPIFIAFKIPDYLTNRSLHTDSAQVVREVLSTAEQQEKHAQQISQRHESLYQQVRDRLDSGQRFQPGDPIICPNNPDCQVDENNPDSVVKNTLINIINSTSGRCHEPIIFEDAGDIYTSTSLDLEGSALSDSPFSPTNNLANPQSKNFSWIFRMNNYERYQQNLRAFENPDSQGLFVNAYIVAPLGIEQEVVFEALQGAFFSDLEQQKLRDDNIVTDSQAHGVYPKYFPIKGAEFGLDAFPNMQNFTFTDLTNCEIEWICPEEIEFPEGMTEEEMPTICYPQEICQEKEFGKGVREDKPNYLFIFGAQVGWAVRKIQETITASGTQFHAYFSSCERVEDMFLGRCGGRDDYGPPRGSPYAGRAPGTGWSGYGRCVPITDENNHCNVNNLREKLANYIQERGLAPISDAELTKRATQASIICNAESGGNPEAANTGCLTGTTVDYSIGLFQINLLAHNCPEYFTYTWNPPSCSINSPFTQNDVDLCAEPLFDPNTNIRKAFDISGAGSNWRPWATAREYSCGPIIYSL